MKISTRKRLAVLVTMGAMLVGMLAGCGGSSSAPSGTTGGGTATEAAAGQTTAGQTTAAQTTAAGNAQGKQEINIWHYFGTESMQVEFQKWVDEYNAQSDTAFVKVTVLPFADFKKQLSMSAVADSCRIWCSLITVTVLHIQPWEFLKISRTELLSSLNLTNTMTRLWQHVPMTQGLRPSRRIQLPGTLL